MDFRAPERSARAGHGDAGAGRSGPRAAGYHNNNQRPDLVAGQSETNECIVRAFREGESAEAVAAYSTAEGDPIVNYIRVLGPGRVEVFIDTTADTFGPQQWTHRVCKRLHEGQGYLEPDRCTNVAVDEIVGATE